MQYFCILIFVCLGFFFFALLSVTLSELTCDPFLLHDPPAEILCSIFRQTEEMHFKLCLSTMYCFTVIEAPCMAPGRAPDAGPTHTGGC